jgi:hypothetical protein
MSGGVVAGEEAGADREFVRGEAQGLAGDGLGDAVQLEKDVPRADDGHPILGLAFAFAHSGFWRTGGYRLVWKNADPEFAFALHVAGQSDTSGLDLRVGDPTPFKGLKAEFTEVDLKIA